MTVVTIQKVEGSTKGFIVCSVGLIN